MLLFSRYFSLGNQSALKNYCGVDHTVDRFVDTINCRFNYPPLLIYDYQSLFEFRSTRGKVQLRKNIALSFEDILPTGIYMPGVSPGGGGASQVARCFSVAWHALACLHNIVFNDIISLALSFFQNNLQIVAVRQFFAAVLSSNLSQ
jgi:hypothetical protein